MTCQLSHIMRESHACRTKISISCMETNLWQIWIKICYSPKPIKWKFKFGKKIIQKMSIIIYVFRTLQQWPEIVRSSSEISGNIRNIFRKWGDGTSRHLGKVGRPYNLREIWVTHRSKDSNKVINYPKYRFKYGVNYGSSWSCRVESQWT